MGFRDPVSPAADTLDTGGTAQRVVIGEDGRVLLYPDDYQDPAFPFLPGELSAAAVVDGLGVTTVSATLASPPDPDSGFQAALVLGWQRSTLQTTQLLDLNAAEVLVPAPRANGDAAQHNDTGWADLPIIGGGVTHGGRRIRYRRLNGVVFLNVGALSNGWVANQHVGTLPSVPSGLGFRPAASTSLDGAYPGLGQFTEVTVDTGGVIRVTGASGAGTAVGLTFSGSFPV